MPSSVLPLGHHQVRLFLDQDLAAETQETRFVFPNYVVGDISKPASLWHSTE